MKAKNLEKIRNLTSELTSKVSIFNFNNLK